MSAGSSLPRRWWAVFPGTSSTLSNRTATSPRSVPSSTVRLLRDSSSLTSPAHAPKTVRRSSTATPLWQRSSRLMRFAMKMVGDKKQFQNLLMTTLLSSLVTSSNKLDLEREDFGNRVFNPFIDAMLFNYHDPRYALANLVTERDRELYR